MSQSLTTTQRRAIPGDNPYPELIEGLVRLIFIGLAMQMIYYVVYIVAFPLISNTQAGGPAEPILESLDHHAHTDCALAVRYSLVWADSHEVVG